MHFVKLTVLQAIFGASSQKNGKTGFRDEDFFMSHYRQDAHTEKGYDYHYIVLIAANY